MIAWQFKTRRFTVRLLVTDCPDNPADSFADKRTARDIRAGKYAWFDARVVVLDKRGKVLSGDSLCECAYNSVHEFISGHRDRDPMNRNSSIMRAAHGSNVRICHYFPSMVLEAVRDARLTLAARSGS